MDNKSDWWFKLLVTYQADDVECGDHVIQRAIRLLRLEVPSAKLTIGYGTVLVPG